MYYIPIPGHLMVYHQLNQGIAFAIMYYCKSKKLLTNVSCKL